MTASAAGIFTGAGAAGAVMPPPANIPTGGQPRLIVMSPDGTTAYIGDSGIAGKVYVLDVATDSVTHTISVGDGAEGIGISPDGSTVYTANFFDDSVSVVDTATNTVTGAIVGLGANPQSVAFTPDGTKAYIGNYGDGSVSVIDTATNTVTATISLTPVVRQIVVSKDGTKAFVADYGSNTIEVIDTATDTLESPITLAGSPWGLALSPDGTKLYSTLDAGGLSIIDTANDTVTSSITAGIDNDTTNVTISPDGLTAYVTDTASNELQVIDLTTGTVTQTIAMPADPFGLAFTKDGTKLYVANNPPGGGSISVFSTFPVIAATAPAAMKVGAAYSFTVASTGTPTFAVTSGALPAGITLDPATGVLSGTPTAAGSATFAITATNANGTNTRRFSVNVASAVLAADAAPTLPATGAASLPLSLLAIALLTLGVGLLVVTRSYESRKS
jgi:YVTN family beta-propeller protein